MVSVLTSVQSLYIYNDTLLLKDIHGELNILQGEKGDEVRQGH
jgi:hypothetical protein